MLEVIPVQGFYPLKINQFPNGVHLKLQYKLRIRQATTTVLKIEQLATDGSRLFDHTCQ